MGVREDWERIEAALAPLGPDLGPLAAAARLQRELPGELGRRAALLRELRVRARAKLEGAEGLVLTRRGLEQSSATPVARTRAQRIAARTPGAPVVDTTAGIGSDTLALNAAGLALLAVERDAETTSCLAENLRRHGVPGRVVRADATALPLAGALERWVVVLDPDRRAGVDAGERRRVGDPEGWSPRWSECTALAASARGAAIKLPPSTEPAALPLGPLANRPHEWQWVSLGGELRELALWTGDLASATPEHEALVLHNDGTATSVRGRPSAAPILDPQSASEVAWIAEPDPAVLRSGLVGELARETGLAALAPGLGYLGGEIPPTSRLCVAWPVLGSVPLDRKRVQALLAEHDVGKLTVKKRGHPEPAEALARRFGGRGRRRGLLVVAGLSAGHRAYLVDPTRRQGS